MAELTPEEQLALINAQIAAAQDQINALDAIIADRETKLLEARKRIARVREVLDKV